MGSAAASRCALSRALRATPVSRLATGRSFIGHFRPSVERRLLAAHPRQSAQHAPPSLNKCGGNLESKVVRPMGVSGSSPAPPGASTAAGGGGQLTDGSAARRIEAPYHIRDVSYGEDASHAHTGNRVQAMAAAASWPSDSLSFRRRSPGDVTGTPSQEAVRDVVDWRREPSISAVIQATRKGGGTSLTNLETSVPRQSKAFGSLPRYSPRSVGANGAFPQTPRL